MYDVIMPKLGLDMESGTILSWYKREGEPVAKGEALFEVETAKVTMDVEAAQAGYLRKILRDGGEVPVNEVVAYIGALDEAIPVSVPVTAPAALQPEIVVVAGQPAPPETPPRVTPLAREVAREYGVELARVTGTGPGGRIVCADVKAYREAAGRLKISPLARRICRESGVEYQTASIPGSAPNGRILKADVLAYVERQRAAAQAMPPVNTPETAVICPTTGAIAVQSTTLLTGIRKVIAERMSLSKQTIPHIVLHAKADATALVAFREKLKEKVNALYGVKLTYTDIFLKMCAATLREHRGLNAALHNGEHIIYADINVGFAVAVGDALVVPTIYRCDQLSLLEIARKKTELVADARNGRLSLDAMSNGTFTVTNLGMFRIRSASPIINPPQAAILAVGELYEEPAAIAGRIEIRSFLELSLACDHRLIDGVAGAKFLQHIVELIEEPDLLIV